MQDMTTLKEKFLKTLNSWEQIQKEQHTYWHNGTFHHNKHDTEQFTKTWIYFMNPFQTGVDQEGLTSITLKPNQSVGKAKGNTQPNLKDIFSNRQTFNQRGFKRENIP